MKEATHSETWIDFIKGIFPEVTKEEVEFILWECTAFPMGGSTHTKKQIQDMKDNSDGTLKDAITKALAEA